MKISCVTFDAADPGRGAVLGGRAGLGRARKPTRQSSWSLLDLPPGYRNVVPRDPEGNEFCLGSETPVA